MLQSLTSDICSADASVRKRAIVKFSDSISKNYNKVHEESFVILLRAIINFDPDHEVRCSAIASPFCPEGPIVSAIYDKYPNVRIQATNTLTQRIIKQQTFTDQSKHLFNLLSMESESNVIVSVLNNIQSLFSTTILDISTNILISALGIVENERDVYERVFREVDIDAILQDLVEHEDPIIRSATARTLTAILFYISPSKYKVGSEHSAKQSSDKSSNQINDINTRICSVTFDLLQVLLCDIHFDVRTTTTNAMVSIVDSVNSISETTRLHENSLISLFELFRYDQVDKCKQQEAVLNILSNYPCATVIGYNDVSVFLRRTKFKCDAVSGLSLSRIQEFIEKIYKQNEAFARVCDMFVPFSDKLMIPKNNK